MKEDRREGVAGGKHQAVALLSSSSHPAGIKSTIIKSTRGVERSYERG
jgi:hypothetical protein